MLVPLALVSAAWTANLAGAGITSASADQKGSGMLPDGTTVPTQAINAPASVSTPGVVAPGIQGNPQKAVSSASASGIPDAALVAYQRAETVINSADRSCKLPWQLIAAIGRVESDHGRANGNRLNNKGVSVPGIYGIALNGKNNTQKIADTDGGQYDGDAKFDRAVGPMQFIPSTWAVVGVDGDNDGQRNPQDIDDAALATAVYLCSGKDDLSTIQGDERAVFRYNHSSSYVSLVLSIMDAYMKGDFTAVPNGTSNAGYFVPAPAPAVKHSHGPRHHPVTHHHGTPQAPSAPTQQPTSSPTSVPTAPSTGGGGGGGGGVSGVPNPPVPVPTPSVPPVKDPMTYAEAVKKCTDAGVQNTALNPNAVDDCANALLDGKSLSDILKGLGIG